MGSIWKRGCDEVRFGALEGNIDADVLIIGGGMAGILCAYMMKNAGIDAVLIESRRILGGVTENTTAKITYQHGFIYEKLIRQFGEDGARLYAEAQKWALDEYGRLCGGIECDYEIKDSAVYSLFDRSKAEGELYAMKRLGIDAEFSESLDIPFKIAGAVTVREQAQFNPLAFAYNIARGLTIYENTKGTSLMPGKAVTNRGEIRFKHAVVATHFPILNKHGSYFLKMYQHRSYVIALEGAGSVNGMYVDEDNRGLSFRTYKDKLLLGGGGHRTGKKGGSYNVLEEFAKKHYPDARIAEKWATQDCMTLDGAPYIGQYSLRTPELYTATGFNKWGMTSSMVSAAVLTDLVRGRKNKYTRLFSPSRSIMRPQLALNAIESVVGLLTPTTPRCPHLGCALRYNKAEHSWDCPCHGSRFTEDGELICGPATDDKKM